MKLVVGDLSFEELLADWRRTYPAVEFVVAPSLADQIAAIGDADGYIGRIRREVFLAAGPRLRWVHSGGAGIEGLAAIPEFVASDVTLTNTRGGHAPVMAEHAFAMLLALTRRLPDLLADQREHLWRLRDRSEGMWRQSGVTTGLRGLSGATMVIVGMGNIGQAIAKRAIGFELRVLGVDLRPVAPSPGVEAIWPLARLDEALALADVVAVATPKTPETRRLLDARRVGLLRPGAYLLVMSRGGIVDEPALIEALQEGRLAGAGLDVAEREPLPPDDPLWDAPHLILTPHISPISDVTRDRVWAITTENVGRFVRGEPLINVCDKRAGF